MVFAEVTILGSKKGGDPMKTLLVPICVALFLISTTSLEAGGFGRQCFSGQQSFVVGNGGQQSFFVGNGGQQSFSVGGGCGGGQSFVVARGGQSFVVANNGFGRQPIVIQSNQGFNRFFGGRQQVIVVRQRGGFLSRFLGGF